MEWMSRGLAVRLAHRQRTVVEHHQVVGSRTVVEVAEPEEAAREAVDEGARLHGGRHPAEVDRRDGAAAVDLEAAARREEAEAGQVERALVHLRDAAVEAAPDVGVVEGADQPLRDALLRHPFHHRVGERDLGAVGVEDAAGGHRERPGALGVLGAQPALADEVADLRRPHGVQEVGRRHARAVVGDVGEHHLLVLEEALERLPLAAHAELQLVREEAPARVDGRPGIEPVGELAAQPFVDLELEARAVRPLDGEIRLVDGAGDGGEGERDGDRRRELPASMEHEPTPSSVPKPGRTRVVADAVVRNAGAPPPRMRMRPLRWSRAAARETRRPDAHPDAASGSCRRRSSPSRNSIRTPRCA
jgi:hypothetical protein